MSATPDRDRDVEQLLKRVMPAGAAPTTDCLDAETLAAWADDGLDARARASAEAHVAGCARCQALLAVIVRSEPAVATPLPWWRTSIVRWMAPALVTIGAATLWFLLPHPEPLAPADDIQVQARGDIDRLESEATEVAQAPTSAAVKAAPAPPPPAPAPAAPRLAAPSDTRPAARPSAAPAFAPEAPLRETVVTAEAADKREANAVAGRPAQDERAIGASPGRQSAQALPSAPAEAAAAPSVIVPMAAGRDAMRQQARARIAGPWFVASPHPGERWRIEESTIGFSVDDGATWERVAASVTPELTHGVSPARGVCWLVGRGGAVMLTVDGRHWNRVAFPEPVDLARIEARDARTASVTTIDGRVFVTTDAGATWR